MAQRTFGLAFEGAVSNENQRQPPVAGSAEDSLLSRFVAGESEAIAWIARLAKRVVLDRGYRIPDADRDDIVQECVLHTYRACTQAGFRLDGTMTALVRSIAYRRCVDWLRRRRADGPVNPNWPDNRKRPDEELVAQERLDLGRRVIESLKEPCGKLMRWRAIDRLSYRDVAERLGTSEGAARNIMYRCLKQARDILEAFEAGAIGGAAEEAD